MELIHEQTAEERFKAANDAMSEHCFKAGRLKYTIELDEEELDTKRRELANMRVDFDKLRKEFIKAQESVAKERQSQMVKEKEVTPEVPDL